LNRLSHSGDQTLVKGKTQLVQGPQAHLEVTAGRRRSGFLSEILKLVSIGTEVGPRIGFQ
jgi:hypothetical protein